MGARRTQRRYKSTRKKIKSEEMAVADFRLFHGVHLEFMCAPMASASRSWRTGHRKIETSDSASQNSSSPHFPQTMLPGSAEIGHIFLCDRILVDPCRFRLACPRFRRVGIPASMEVLPDQPIFSLAGGFWPWPWCGSPRHGDIDQRSQ